MAVRDHRVVVPPALSVDGMVVETQREHIRVRLQNLQLLLGIVRPPTAPHTSAAADTASPTSGNRKSDKGRNLRPLSGVRGYTREPLLGALRPSAARCAGIRRFVRAAGRRRPQGRGAFFAARAWNRWNRWNRCFRKIPQTRALRDFSEITVPSVPPVPPPLARSCSVAPPLAIAASSAPLSLYIVCYENNGDHSR
jgi:hypothetical protein